MMDGMLAAPAASAAAGARAAGAPAGSAIRSAGHAPLTPPLSRPRVLFVNHTSRVSGAEMILLDAAPAWDGREGSAQGGSAASAFLFEDGPLRAGLEARGIPVQVARRAGSFAGFRRDSSPWRALPMAAGMGAMVLEIARAARRHDLVYANSQKAFVLAAPAAALARRPLVWHLHDILDAAHFGPTQRRLAVGLANRFARRVIVPSQAAADAFGKAGGLAGLVRVVPNGLDLRPDPLPRPALRRELGLPEGPLLAGVFSRLSPWKGQHVAIEALAALPSSPDVRLLVAGSALFGEEDYAASLRQLAARLGVTDRVLFLGQRSDVPRLMRAVDAVIHPSVDPEPFGRTLVEAMLLRTPLVASSAGAAPEILEGGRAGALVPPGDAAALAAALARALVRGPEVEAELSYAEARALGRYGRSAMQAALRDTVAELLPRLPARANAPATAPL